MNREMLSSLFCLVFGIYYTVESYRCGIGSWIKPGPGFFPFGAGILFDLLSFFVFIIALRRGSARTNNGDRFQWRNIVLILFGMFVYATLLSSLGFVLCNFCLAVFCIRIVAHESWGNALVTSLVIAIAFHILFNVLLNAQIPRGILGYIIG